MTVHARDIESGFERFLYRVMGAAMLDGDIYEGIDADPHLTRQAAVVVLLSALAAGLGAQGLFGIELAVFAKFTGLALVTWIAWAFLIAQIGNGFMATGQRRTGVAELLRTTGFAAAPGLLQVFAVLPRMALPVLIVAWLWTIAAMVVGVRYAFQYERLTRAMAVCLAAAALLIGLVLALGVTLSLADAASMR